jgi:hypothetical protein
MILRFENGLQRPSGTAVSATRIMENYGEVMHRQPPALRNASLHHQHLKLVLRGDKSFINFP